MSGNTSLVPYSPKSPGVSWSSSLGFYATLVAGALLMSIGITAGAWKLGEKLSGSEGNIKKNTLGDMRANYEKSLQYKSDTPSSIDWIIRRNVNRRSRVIDQGHGWGRFIVEDIHKNLEKIIEKFAKELFYKKKDESRYGTCGACGGHFFPYKQLPKNVVREFDLYDWRLWEKSPEELEKDWNEIFFNGYDGKEFFEIQDGQDNVANIGKHMAKLIVCKMIPAYIYKIKKEWQERLGLRVAEGEVCQYQIDRQLEQKLDSHNPVRHLLAVLREGSHLDNHVFWDRLRFQETWAPNAGNLSNFDKEVLARLYLYNLMFENLFLEKGEKPQLDKSLLEEADNYLKFFMETSPDNQFPAEDWKNSWRYSVILSTLMRNNNFVNNPLINSDRTLKKLANQWITGIGYKNDFQAELMGDVIMGRLLRWKSTEEQFISRIVDTEEIDPANQNMTAADIIKFRDWLKEKNDLAKLAIYNSLKYLEDLKNEVPEPNVQREIMKIFEGEV